MLGVLTAQVSMGTTTPCVYAQNRFNCVAMLHSLLNNHSCLSVLDLLGFFFFFFFFSFHRVSVATYKLVLFFCCFFFIRATFVQRIWLPKFHQFYFPVQWKSLLVQFY